MESKCLVDTTNFIKTKNHFNPFLSIFAFFSKVWCIFLTQKYTLTSHHIKEKCSFFGIWFLWVLTYHNMQKHCENPSYQWHGWSSIMGPLKNSTMWQQSWFPHSVLSLQIEQVFVYFLILDHYSTIGG